MFVEFNNFARSAVRILENVSTAQVEDNSALSITDSLFVKIVFAVSLFDQSSDISDPEVSFPMKKPILVLWQASPCIPQHGVFQTNNECTCIG